MRHSTRARFVLVGLLSGCTGTEATSPALVPFGGTPADATGTAGSDSAADLETVSDAADGPDAPSVFDTTTDSDATGGPDVAEDLDASVDPDIIVPLPPTGLCAAQGRAMVRELADGERLEGPESLGSAGDWVLANDVAAFVIQRPYSDKTYYYYGGLPIDAAPVRPVDGVCEQTGPETYGELAFAVGTLNPGDFAQSILRGFRGESAEIIADGTDGGPVTLRVTGSDQPFWLVEYQLIQAVASSGGKKLFSSPLGLTMAVDYTLLPGDPVLRMELHVTNTTPAERDLFSGSVTFAGDSTRSETAPSGELTLGGFGLKTGSPWLAAFGSTSWALGVVGIELATLNIAGADVLLDLGQLSVPLHMGPAGSPTETATQTWFLAVGQGGTDVPVTALVPHLAPGQQTEITPLSGTVTQEGTLLPVAGARVEITRTGPNGSRVPVVTTLTDAAGHYTIGAPAFADARIAAAKTGAPVSEPTSLAGAASPFALTLGRPGVIAYDITEDGVGVPARIQLFQGEDRRVQIYGLGVPGEREVPPGTYDVVVARGYEYSISTSQLTIVAGQSTPLKVSLTRLVDTSGYLSFDGHVHAGPSGDSLVPLVERVRSAAADGLEVIGHTDHEFIADPAPANAASGVSGWVASLPGEELTATAPEHLSVWDLAPDPTHPRGRPFIWFQKDLPTLYAEVKARGGMVALNHPRTTRGCNYLCLIEWDRALGAPGITDPTRVGLIEGAQLWSWSFDAMELYNGLNNLFALGLDKRAGVFDDWMSFLNHGHTVSVVASTDVHGDDGVGSPRTYFAAPTDDPTAFAPDLLRTAVASGDLTLSAGAFVRASIDGQGPGKTVKSQGGQITLHIDVRGIPEIDVSRVSVFINCDEAVRIPATAPSGTQKVLVDQVLPVPVDSHVVVVAFGKDAMPRGFDAADPLRVPRAVTNAIYVDANGDGSWTAPGGKLCYYSLDP